MKIQKRNGLLVDFDSNKIRTAILKACKSVGSAIPISALDSILEDISVWEGIDVETIQDEIDEVLRDYDYASVADAYKNYRERRAEIRESKNKETFFGIINAENNEVTRENANMNSDSPAGMMMKFASETTKPFVDRYCISDNTRQYVENNIIHIHDKDYYPTKSLTCVQTPLDKILHQGFKSGHGESRGAKRIETAATLACISMETTQNEQHGGQAIPAFDFYLAPFVRMTFEEEYRRVAEFVELSFTDIPNVNSYDYHPVTGTIENKVYQQSINNTIKRVHQAMEGFIHNMNQIHSRGGKL